MSSLIPGNTEEEHHTNDGTTMQQCVETAASDRERWSRRFAATTHSDK